MRRSWILTCLVGAAALACVLPVQAQVDTEREQSARASGLAEVQNSFSGPTGGIRIIDAGSGPKGTFRLALNTEFFIARDFFFPSDQTHYFAGNLSLNITPTEYLEVFVAAEATSAWDDSNDPLLIQRVADLLLGLKGFYEAKPWLTVGGDASLAFLGGVGDAKATFRATSFGFRGNLSFDFRDHERRAVPLIARFNAQYWFDNSAKLTEGIEDQRYQALGGAIPPSMEVRHLLTPFERYAYGMNRTDFVRIAAGLEAPLQARKVGLHPMLEWQWDIPVNRQGYQCPAGASSVNDSCLSDEGLKAFPMLLTMGLRILTPPKGLAFTVAADVGLTGTRHFVRELAPTAPYNIILGIGFAFDPRPATPVSAGAEPVPVRTAKRTGQVRGHVLQEGSGEPIVGAVVTVPGQDASPQLTDSAGRFVTYALPKGEAQLEVSHPDYETVRCIAAVPSNTDCLLVPSSHDGQLRVAAVDAEGNPVPKIAISVRGPTEHLLFSDDEGESFVDAIEPGSYTAYVDDPAYLISERDFEVRARQESSVQLRILPKPSRPRVVVRKTEITLRRQISFATGSDEILPNSEPILLEVVDALLRNPDIELVEIQGHTDNRGGHELNMRLSQQRAEAVMRALTASGVEPARLMAKGYGPTRPIAPNITAHNRARNRRVQFKIVRRGDATAVASP